MRTRMRLLPSLEETAPHSSRSESRESRPAVFVVDDDVATLELLCEIARDAGWSARGFTHLSELRTALTADRPQLMILDDDLPDGRGGDLARELRADDRTADVPTLVCTAAHPMRQAEIGAWAPVVTKPFDLLEIESFLAAAARRRDGPDSYRQRAG